MTRPESRSSIKQPDIRLPLFEGETDSVFPDSPLARQHLEGRQTVFPRLACWSPFPDDESDRTPELGVEPEVTTEPASFQPGSAVEMKEPTPSTPPAPCPNDKIHDETDMEAHSSFLLPDKMRSSDRPISTSLPVAPLSGKTSIPFGCLGREILVTEGLTKSYSKSKLKIPVLKGVDFTAYLGEFVSIVGQSGSGKSTLLHLLGTLDKPDSGTIQFDGKRVDNLPISRRDTLRNRSIGFIFQFYHLLPELTTLENVLSPLMIRESVFGYMMRRRDYLERGKEILEQVGLSHRLKHRPGELSGGEMQRAAIARALISEPTLLLADEPTGNLDSASAGEIIDILRRLNMERKLTIVMVTHDNVVAAAADRTVRMVDGVIVSESDRVPG